jgi:DNA-binding transcriptional ArsR family regulator
MPPDPVIASFSRLNASVITEASTQSLCYNGSGTWTACDGRTMLMKEGPALAPLAALIGDPARANMLGALMSGLALTASELAREAGVMPQTASGHLARLETGGLVNVAQQGRHRYYRLSGPDVAQALESLMGLAARTGHMRTRPGPKDEGLREARTCYDHLAGTRALALFDGLQARGHIADAGKDIAVTAQGRPFFCDFGIDMAGLEQGRRPLCRACLDWSMRRPHLGGALGAALLDRMFALGWAARSKTSRAVLFTPKGDGAFAAWLSKG